MENDMDEVPNTAKASKKRHGEQIVEKTKFENDEKLHFKNKHKNLKARADKVFGLENVKPENVNSKSNLIMPYIKEKKKLEKEERLSQDKEKETKEKLKKKEELKQLKEKVKESKNEVKAWKESKLEEEKAEAAEFDKKRKEKEKKDKEKRLKEIEERKQRSEQACNEQEEVKESYTKRTEFVQTRKEDLINKKREIVLTQKGDIIPEEKEVKINGEKYMEKLRETRETEENNKQKIEELTTQWNDKIKPKKKAILNLYEH